jgi:hypothetical protein
MSLKHSIQALLTLVPLALAGPITRRNANEAVVLANCATSWGEWSSEMAYYSTGGSSPSGTPAATAVVKNGNFQVWEGAQVSGTFGDGNVFTSNIAEPVSIHGMYAGTGQNSQSSFYCYQDAGSVTYPLSNGATCTSVYICDHTPAGVHVDISTNENYVELVGLGNVNAADVFNNVWAKRGAQSCDTTPVDLGQGCSISFTCSGGIPWTTTNGMASTLESVVAAQNGISNHWTTQETSCTAYVGESEGPVCVQETTTNVDHTSIAQTITIVSLHFSYYQV